MKYLHIEFNKGKLYLDGIKYEDRAKFWYKVTNKEYKEIMEKLTKESRDKPASTR